MVDSHRSGAFEPYFEKVYLLNIQNKHFFCFCKCEFLIQNIIHTITMTLTVLCIYLLNQIHCGACPHNNVANSKKGAML